MTPPPVSQPAPDSRAACLARLDQVSLLFDGVPLFSRLSLCIHRNEHLALLGPNGSGKSSLFRLLQGELRPSPDASCPGRVYWNIDGREESFVVTARKHVRLVSPALQRQYVRQGWKISGEEILLSGLDNAPMLYGEVESRHYKRAAELAEAAGAAALMGMTAPAMSQGQLRLVLILRALMSGPALLLLDEPFDGLDAPSRERISHCISLAVARGCALLVSAHRREDIPDSVSEALVLRDGTITRTRLVDLPADFVAESDSCPTPASRTTLPLTAQPTRPLLELSKVDVFIDRRQVLFDVNWSIRQGEHWVLTGANGSGKSTLLRLIYGEEFAAYGGQYRWQGGPRPALDDLREQIGYVSDRLQHEYAYDCTAEDVVISGLRGSMGLYHEPDKEERARACAHLERMGLSALAGRNFHSLSSGQARRVLLARALAAAHRLLLLDEPCSGLDAGSRALFLQSLPVLAAQGVTIVHVSHHKEDAGPLFSHELHLHQGRVAFCGQRRL